MIVVTGAAGFIGSNVVAEFEAASLGPIVAVDWPEPAAKWRNLAAHRIAASVRPDCLLDFLDQHSAEVTLIVHMGAITSTTDRYWDRLMGCNVSLTIALWDWCAAHEVPFIYASSAATYGARETHFTDDESVVALAALRPLNAYGWSKKITDDIIAMRLAQGSPRPPQWIGLKFFNVYGPNEYHKSNMMSVATKLFQTLARGEQVRLFKSYRGDVEDGYQRRDFVYVKDCSRSILWFAGHVGVSGLFNIGSGKAQSFVEIVQAFEAVLHRRIEIEFIDMPEGVREQYQYFTEADMTKAAAAGLDIRFADLHHGIGDFVANFLSCDNHYR